VLKVFNDALALESVVFRAIEAVFHTVGVVSLLSLPTAGPGLVAAPPADPTAYQPMGDLLLAVRDRAATAGVSPSLWVLHVLLLFYRSRLVPRWLGWGVAGACVMLIACVLALIRNPGRAP
jgi:hypothetical protein